MTSLEDIETSPPTLQLIDVRSPSEFADGHIPGAINIPMEEVGWRLADIKSNHPVTIVCESGDRAGMVKNTHFSDNPNVTVLKGGTRGWRESGKEIVGAGRSGALPIMRQVQIVAGSMIVLGFLLSWLLHPYWLALSFFVGCGLIFAGVSGYCGMAMVLQKMPWNKRPSNYEGEAS